MIVTDFLKAFGQLWDPRFQKVLWSSVAWAVVVLLAISAALVGMVNWLVSDSKATWGVLVLVLGGSVFIMMPVTTAIMGMKLDEIAHAVEARHYPHLPPAPVRPLSEVFADTSIFLGIFVLANLFLLVVYLGSGPMAPLIFWVVNGYLLGREYFQMVAMRRYGRTGATQLRKRHSRKVWSTGILLAIPLTIPVVNLLMPILGAATFTHQMHRLTKEAPSG